MTGSLPIDLEQLGTAMPMFMVLSPDGKIQHVGPTLMRVRGRDALLGQYFSDVFDMRRPRVIVETTNALPNIAGEIHVNFRHPPHSSLRGVWMPQANGGALLNLSFGIGVVEAVSEYNLTLGDFAATDLAVELLYMVEAKSAVLQELRNLTGRLDTARIAAEERAFTDTLTGLRNRRAMDHVLDETIAARTPFALMNIDLDFFKSVNDTHGHAAGDHVLEYVARVLTAETRAVDTAARVGGDEFVLLLQGVVSASRLMTISKRVIERLEVPIPFEDIECKISASIGFTTSLRYRKPNASDMMADADVALYQSKRDGRGRATNIDDMDAASLARAN